MIRRTALLLAGLATFATPSLAAADGPSLLQAAFDRGKSNYTFGYRSIPRIDIIGAPADTDFSRWAMLHDGKVYRLYFFRRGQAALYQFGFNTKTNRYEHGHQSIPQIPIVGAPGDADMSSFAMLHDGKVFRLYFRGKQKKTTLYQFGFNTKSNRYEFGHQSIPQIPIVGAPADADLSRWGMLHDGQYFRLYAASGSSDTVIHQFGFDPRGSKYAYGYKSIPKIALVGQPADADSKSFALLHDGTDFRFYRQRL